MFKTETEDVSPGNPYWQSDEQEMTTVESCTLCDCFDVEGIYDQLPVGVLPRLLQVKSSFPELEWVDVATVLNMT